MRAIRVGAVGIYFGSILAIPEIALPIRFVGSLLVISSIGLAAAGVASLPFERAPIAGTPYVLVGFFAAIVGRVLQWGPIGLSKTGWVVTALYAAALTGGYMVLISFVVSVGMALWGLLMTEPSVGEFD